jgi:hypothetical protein
MVTLSGFRPRTDHLMFKFPSKPAWESRDPAARARAIAAADAAALGPRLAEFARADAAAEVRAAALRRLDDLPLLGDRARLDPDAGVRALAAARYRTLLCDARLPAAQRERVLRVEDDPDVLAHVAAQAPEPALRLLAIERHGKPGLLAERCQRDPDPEVRLQLLALIAQPATLERIAEATRRSDKRLSHAARERAFALRLAAGDPEARRSRALAIADALDLLRRERPGDLPRQREALLGEWSALAPHLDPALVRRVQGFIDALEAALAPRPLPADEPAPAAQPVVVPTDADGVVEPAAHDPDPELIALADEAEGHARDLDAAGIDDLRRRLARAWDRRRSHVTAELDARQRFEAALAGVRERLAQEAAARAAEDAAQRAAREADEAAARQELDALLAALAAERAQDARDAWAALAARRKARSLPSSLARRFAAAQEAYDRLVRWQHWSNNKVRTRLCEEIEALAGAGAHPDAVASRVREAQAEWQRLDASERLDAEAAARSGLARRFRAVCHRALAPARAYFDKRGELRERRRADLDALLARAEGEPPSDPRAASALRRELSEAIRRLDEVDPRHRAGLGKRLRAAIERLDAARDARAAAVEADKRRAIAQLRRQLAQATGEEALALARDAQARIASMPRAGRAAEDALRAELAALVAPLFSAERAQRESAQAATREREAAAAAVLAELASLAEGDADALRHADARIAALQARWRELAPPRATPAPSAGERGAHGPRRGPDRGRRDAGGEHDRRPPRDDRRRDEDRRFDAAVERVRAAQRALQARQRDETLRRLLAAVDACAAVEAALILGAKAPDTAALDAALDGLTLPAALRQRVERLRAWRDGGDAPLAQEVATASEAGADLAVLADALRGVESPPEARERRRAWQMRRLAERLRGGAAPDPAAERKALLDAWLALGPLPAAEREALAQRIVPALRGD